MLSELGCIRWRKQIRTFSDIFVFYSISRVKKKKTNEPLYTILIYSLTHVKVHKISFVSVCIKDPELCRGDMEGWGLSLPNGVVDPISVNLGPDQNLQKPTEKFAIEESFYTV